MSLMPLGHALPGGQHTTCRAARPHAMGPITPTLDLVYYLAQFCSESLSFCVKHQHTCTEKRAVSCLSPGQGTNGGQHTTCSTAWPCVC